MEISHIMSNNILVYFGQRQCHTKNRVHTGTNFGNKNRSKKMVRQIEGPI